jgi:hypothetical protein
VGAFGRAIIDVPPDALPSLSPDTAREVAVPALPVVLVAAEAEVLVG